MELIRKYDRYQTTITGSENSSITRKMQDVDPKVCTFIGMLDGIILVFASLLGLLPYIELRHELAALPYMTSDFIKMK
jgi:hypothetical protein